MRRHRWMLIAIIADTHLPRGNRQLPPECIERLKEADLIVHAGDFATLPALTELQALGEVVAVHGNVDSSELKATLPPTATFDANGATIAVVHNGGPRLMRLERLHRRFPDADAVIFGHSHTPLHETAEDGFQIFNPGSPTDRRRAPNHTMGLARTSDRKVSFDLVDLD